MPAYLESDTLNLPLRTVRVNLEARSYDIEIASCLLDCIAELAGSSRRVVDMKYGEGRRSREIGELIKKSTEAVDMMLSRIRKALRECVDRKTIDAQ